MSQVPHHVVMAQNERILKEEVLRLQESVDKANDLAIAKAKQWVQEYEELKKSVEELKTAKVAVEEDLKREKANAEAARDSVEKLKQSLEAARLAKKDLGAKVDLAEARVNQLETQNKLALDNLAKVDAETKEKINSGRDDLIDLAMYRVWEYNQGIDISFIRGEVEGLLKKWKAQMEEEKELRSIAASEALSEDDEAGDEASFLGLKLPKTPAMLIAKIRSAMDQVVKETEPAAAPTEPPTFEDDPTIQL